MGTESVNNVKYLHLSIICLCIVKPNNTKVKAIVEFPQPKDVSSLKRFLGTLNFYRKHIKDFAMHDVCVCVVRVCMCVCCACVCVLCVCMCVCCACVCVVRVCVCCACVCVCVVCVCVLCVCVLCVCVHMHVRAHMDVHACVVMGVHVCTCVCNTYI